MDKIIDYIKKNYNPLAVIVYGSYANTTNNLNSDFDALVISADDTQLHDTSFVGDVQLDVFVYPASYFDGDYDYEEFVQIFDGLVVMDTENAGMNLKYKVQKYIESKPKKSSAEINSEIAWCQKMCERVKRNDAEGMFRFHWVLVDSLEIFCNVVGQAYFGPKKALKFMEDNHPEAFVSYQKALSDYSIDSLYNWVMYLNKIFLENNIYES